MEKITCFFAFNFLFAENICGRKAAIQATLCDICATGVLKTLAGDVMQLWPVWSVQRLKCYGRGFFHILKRLGIGIVSFIERVSTTITAQGVNKQPNLLNTAIFSEFVCWAEPAEISILSHRNSKKTLD